MNIIVKLTLVCFAFHLVTCQALTTCRRIVKPTTFIQCRRFLKRTPCYDIPFALYILTIHNKMIHLSHNFFLRMLKHFVKSAPVSKSSDDMRPLNFFLRILAFYIEHLYRGSCYNSEQTPMLYM